MRLTDWLATPASFIQWAIWLFTGPVIFVMILSLGILIIRRPRTLKAMPVNHRHAIIQSEITFSLSVVVTLVSFVVIPWAFGVLNNTDVTKQDTARTEMTVLVPGVISLVWVFTYIISAIFWFPQQRHNTKDRTNNLSVTARRVMAWGASPSAAVTGVIMIVVGRFVTLPSPGVPNYLLMREGVFAVLIGAVVGGSVYLVARLIRRRPPIPGVPIAIDLVHRRADMDRFLRGTGLFMGAMVADSLQSVAYAAFTSGLRVWSVVFLVSAWIVTISTMAMALIPTRVFMRNDILASRYIHIAESEMMRGHTQAVRFSAQILPTIEEVEYHHFLYCEGNYKGLNLPWWKRPSPGDLSRFVPGSGDSPEEISQAIEYLTAVAQGADLEFEEDQLDDIRDLSARTKELAEARARMHAGSLGDLPEDYYDDALDTSKSKNSPEELALQAAKLATDRDLQSILHEMHSTVPMAISGTTLNGHAPITSVTNPAGTYTGISLADQSIVLASPAQIPQPAARPRPRPVAQRPAPVQRAARTIRPVHPAPRRQPGQPVPPGQPTQTGQPGQPASYAPPRINGAGQPRVLPVRRPTPARVDPPAVDPPIQAVRRTLPPGAVRPARRPGVPIQPPEGTEHHRPRNPQ